MFQDLACYLVPELELLLDTTDAVLLVFEGLVEALYDETIEDDPSWSLMSSAEQNLNKALSEKELIHFNCMYGRISTIRQHLGQRK